MKKNFIALVIIILVGLILKITYLAASTIWRVDLFYYIEFARTMLDGGVLYRDFGCSHPPLGYLEFYWMARFFGYDNMYLTIKICIIIIQSFTAYFVFMIFERIFDTVKGILCAVLFLIMISISIEFWPHNIPLTYLLPCFAGFYFLTENNFKPSLKSYALFGFFTACATLISTNVIFYSLIVPLLSMKNNEYDFKKIITECLAAFAGFIIPLGIMAVYFAGHNALGDWFFWNIRWASIYAGYKPWYKKVGHFFYGFVLTWQWIPFFAISFYSIYKIIKTKVYKQSNFAFFVIAVFFTGAMCKMVMNKPNPRYYLYFLPGIFFAVVYGINNMKGKARTAIVSSMSIFIIVSLVVVNINGWKHPCDRSFNVRANLRSWIVTNVSDDKTIYVWDEGFEIYYETKRKKSKTSIFSIREDLDKSRLWRDNKYKDTAFMWKRFLSEFTNNPPDYIVDYTLNFGRTDVEPSDGEREGVHKEYYDKFRAFVDPQYSVAAIIDGKYRILKRNKILL